MRKQDLQVGEEYAAGSSSRHDRFRLARVRVVDLDGERETKTSWGRVQKERGIVVALVGDSDVLLRGRDGDEKVLTTARDIQRPWAAYEHAKAEFDARQAEVRAERARAMRVSDDAAERLVVLGATCTRSGSDFRFSADQMARLLALIPDA